MPITLIRTQKSSIDRTQKFVYRIDRDTGPVQVDIVAIDKQDSEDTLCVPTQTNSTQACNFCHTSQSDGIVTVTNLSGFEIADLAESAWDEAGFSTSGHPLLVSFMGAGEPMTNPGHLLRSMLLLNNRMQYLGTPVRYGLTTMLPYNRTEAFREFAYQVQQLKLSVEVHLSLHYTSDELRKKWMPMAASIESSIQHIEAYRELTRNAVEIHYTLISGVNDVLRDADNLVTLLSGKNITVKLLKYNPVPGDTTQPSPPEWEKFFVSILQDGQVPVEQYDSPGKDIQASCGMFAATNHETPSVQIADRTIFRKSFDSFPVDTYDY